MNIKHNTIANFIGQGYSISIGIFVTPILIKHIGSEAYGLIGFYILMQTWFSLLDFGLSATFGRQAALVRVQNEEPTNIKSLLRTIEVFFCMLSIFSIILIYLNKGFIAHKWLQSSMLTSETISTSLVLISFIISAKWFATIYRSGINGLEDQIFLNVFSITQSTLKHILVIFLLMFISNTIVFYFSYQVLIALIEAITLGIRFYRKKPSENNISSKSLINWKEIQKVIPFSLSIATTSAIFIMISKLDAVILSKLLPLDKFAYFSIISTVTGSMFAIATPVFLAITPRMTLLIASQNNQNSISLYRNMTQIITWISLSACLMIILFSKEILYLLSGQIQAASWGQEIIKWYATGHFFFIIGTFQYYLQNAYGDLKLYLRGTLISTLIQIPILFYMTNNYGAIGAGQAWCAFNLFWFFIFTPIVHSKFLPKFHTNWLLKDIAPIIMTGIILTYLINNIIFLELNSKKIILVLVIAVTSILFTTLSAISVRPIRKLALEFFKSLRIKGY